MPACSRRRRPLRRPRPGFPTQWYARERTAWVIRRSTIEYGVPLHSRRSTSRSSTWVADFRRVRSRREYEVHVLTGPVAALTAHTDWVYVDRASGRPRRIPDAMMNAFVPEGRCLRLCRARRSRCLPEPPDEGASSAGGHARGRRRARPREQCSVLRLRGGGRENGSRGHLRPIRHDLEYLAEAWAGDRLISRCWLVESRESATETAVEILLAADGAPLTRARSLWAA